MLTLEQLLVLKTIVDSGSFRSASEILHKAQSAISYAIKNLESELNIRLFDRSSYRPQLTEEGKAIFHKSKIVLAQVEDLSCLSKHLAKGHESEIRLAINGICPFDNVSKVIKRFSSVNPSVRILLTVENLGGSIERLLLGNADIALAEVTDLHDQLEGVLWDKIEFIPVAAPDYPPAKSTSKLTKSDMMQYTQIVVADSSRQLKPKTAGVLEEAVHWTVNDFSIKRQFLLAGLGWGNMPRHLVDDDLNSNRLVPVPYFSSVNLLVDFYLLKRKDALLGPMTTQLWQLLEESGKSL
jgi:DNA-binding transcriptional LysR family regulator